MKKIGLICLFLLTILTLKASADNAPFWTQKTVWKDNGYVYSVGQAPYNEGMTETVFAKNFKLALDNSVKNLKSELKVKQLKGFQIINTWYGQNKMFVLGAVEESANQSRASVSEPEPDEAETITCPKDKWWKETKVFICQNGSQKYVYAVGSSTDTDQKNAENQATEKAKNLLKEHLQVSELKGFIMAGLHLEIINDDKQVWILGYVLEDQNTAALNNREAILDEHTAYETALKTAGIEPLMTIPNDWWGLYNNDMKTFVFQGQLYAIGWSRVNPEFKSNPTQAKAAAQRGAITDARRNALNAIKPGIKKLKGTDNWEMKISGVIKGSILADVNNNPYFLEKKEMYVLITIPKTS